MKSPAHPSRRQLLHGVAASILVSGELAAAPDKEASAMKKRPAVAVFDVVETLFSLEPLGQRLQDAGLPAHALDAWYTRLIRDGMALDASGVYQPFRAVARAALEVLCAEHHLKRTDEQLDGILAGFAELPAFPDVKPAFQLLRDAKVRVVALTNGNAELTAKLLQRNGLAELVERVISIDEVKHWKPRREVYLHAAQVLKVRPEQLAMTAVHIWDIHGAARAGLTTAWVSRREKHMNRLLGPADVSGAALDEAAKKLLALPAA
jgi:2-haloacid dehalogenase